MCLLGDDMTLYKIMAGIWGIVFILFFAFIYFMDARLLTAVIVLAFLNVLLFGVGGFIIMYRDRQEAEEETQPLKTKDQQKRCLY